MVYGYFPANGDGNDLVIWTDETRIAEQVRFSYPRQTKAPYYCIADFFRPVDGDEVDYAAFSIVTMGPAVSERTAKLFADDRYQEYLLLHGVGVEMAEALAEYWHRRIREEWGFAHEDGPSLAGLFRQQYRGGRYSWGYPACPDLEDNVPVLAPARRRAHRPRVQRGDGLPVPARADHLGAHLPPPPGQVLRRPLTGDIATTAVATCRPPRRPPSGCVTRGPAWPRTSTSGWPRQLEPTVSPTWCPCRTCGTRSASSWPRPRRTATVRNLRRGSPGCAWPSTDPETSC